MTTNAILGMDIPISTALLFRAVKHRDLKIADWSLQNTQLSKIKIIFGKFLFELVFATILLFSTGEFFARNFLFILSTPLYLLEKTHSVSSRAANSVLTNLYTSIFCIETLYYNIVEKCIGKSITSPRLGKRYLNYYKKSIKLI